MFKPKKSLGQNFLTNLEVIAKIIEASELTKEDRVIEVGPGTGILTDELVKHAGEVFAIEKDYDLAQKMRKFFGNKSNLKIVHQDALLFDLSLFEKYKVIANIPYNITSPLIRKFLESENKPELMVLMVQKEVAERIAAKPGSSERGLLTLIVEFYADTEIITEVSRNDFYPKPKVDSTVIKIRVRNNDLRIARVDEKSFFRIVKAGFSAKRRQIHNSLAATLRIDKPAVVSLLEKSGIDPNVRAEDLTLDQWYKLYEEINNPVNRIIE